MYYKIPKELENKNLNEILVGNKAENFLVDEIEVFELIYE